MFKAALSALTSTVMDSAVDTFSSYKPTAANAHGSFERIAHQGIANLSYRSPVLADIAETMLKNFQIEMEKRERINNYVKSGASSNLRNAVTQKVGAGNNEKIDAEMTSILTKLSKSIDRQGLEETKKSALFKEYEEYFEEFKKANPTQQNPQQQPQSGPTGPGLPVAPQLDKIEANTHRTVNVLEEMSTQKSIGGAGGEGGTGTSGISFVDPVTGMPSMRAAIGSIGGSILAKVFDDDFTDKIAARFKGKKLEQKSEVEELLPEVVTAPAPAPVKRKSKVTGAKPQSVSDILGDLSLDLIVPSSSKEDKKEESASIRQNASKVLTVQEAQLEELKKLNDPTTEANKAKKPGTPGLLSSLTDKVMSAGSGIGGLLAKAAPIAGSVAAVGAAGAAGYGIGKYLVNPLIDSGLSAVTGKETSLGGAIYDMFNDDPNAKYNEELKKKLAAQKKTPGTIASDMNSVKLSKEAEQKQAASTLVAVNNQQQAKSPASAPVVMISSSVRNQDSTFERVQMQDFWSRAA
jgi:uncharacterized membrane protein